MSATNSPPSAGQRRSMGQIVVARSLWYVKPAVAELRTERLSAPRPGEARVETLYSAISRGTERLIAHGEVPPSEWTRMRAPLQAGTFPFPVKYGYAAAGTVTAGPDEMLGRTVFCLHPHQDHFQAAADMLHLVPDGIPAQRAVLAANMETALNAHWDAGTAPGDTVLVVGAGIVGLLTAYLASCIAGVHVALTDIDPGRGEFANALGIAFVAPRDLPNENRIVFHTSATAAGLDCALNAAAFEGRIIEMSWYGDKPVSVQLGAAFHSRRLQIIASQVGHIAPAQRNTVTHRQRLAIALNMLNDDRLDALVRDEIAFDDVPRELARIFSSSYRGACPIISYTNTKR